MTDYHTTSPELLPCPFCGGEMTVGGRSFGWFGHKGKVAGKTSDCPIFREDFPPTMREAWNARQPQSLSTSEDAVEQARVAMCCAIAFLGRDVDTPRANDTMEQVADELVKAEANLRAAMKSKEQSK